MIQDLPGDFWFTLKLQSIGDWLTPVMKFFTWLGYPQAYLISITIIYWSIDRKLGLRLAIFLPLTASLNSILKQVFHAPRPYWVNPDIKAIQTSSGFGMPSGHAQGSTVWLYAASILKKKWIWITAILVSVMVGLSRVYLGVHFSSQVLAGWLIGIAVLIAFTYLEKKILKWFLNRRFLIQLIWIGGSTLFLLILGGVTIYLLKDWEMPMAWIRNAAVNPAGINESIPGSLGMSAISGNAGGFMGVALGALLLHRKGGFDPGGTVWKRVLRSLAGLLIILALYGLLMWIAPEETREVAYAIWRFFGFFLLSFLAIYLIPVLLQGIRLFQRA